MTTTETEEHVWQREDWELRDLPATLDLALTGRGVGCRAIWHTPTCGLKQRIPRYWVTGIPTFVAVQTFETASYTSATGWCQNCTIRRVKR